ncbi:hypothetical protein [Nocardia gipuzkoensis]
MTEATPSPTGKSEIQIDMVDNGLLTWCRREAFRRLEQEDPGEEALQLLKEAFRRLQQRDRGLARRVCVRSV